MLFTHSLYRLNPFENQVYFYHQVRYHYGRCPAHVLIPLRIRSISTSRNSTNKNKHQPRLNPFENQVYFYTDTNTTKPATVPTGLNPFENQVYFYQECLL